MQISRKECEKFKMAINFDYDFSGWATKANVKCFDGLTIAPNAFKDCDGKVVPVVWNHDHSAPESVLGHALLQNRKEGVYAYVKLNDTSSGQTAKACVDNGDIDAMSIYANGIQKAGRTVMHGMIKELSLVIAGCNPGALIDEVVKHSADGTETDSSEAYIYTDSGLSLKHGLDPDDNPLEDETLQHSDDSGETDKDKKGESKMADANEKTVKEVFDTLTEEQKNVVYAIIGSALDEGKGGESDDKGDGEEDNTMHHCFENDNSGTVLKHSLDDINGIIATASKHGTLRDAFLDAGITGDELAHSIENMDYLFPDDHNLDTVPRIVDRDQTWVDKVMNSVHHVPFARVKVMFADLTEDEARAKGYIKGNYKKEQVFKLLKRSTTPTTVYKKQRFDRDDIVDMSTMDVVGFVKKEQRGKLNEELGMAFLIGDGRDDASDDKINELNIRPIFNDDDFYTIKVVVQPGKVTDYIQDDALQERAAAQLRETNQDFSMWFIEKERDEVLRLSRGISAHLRAANTISPVNMSEFEERRLQLDKALECCNVLQDELNYIAKVLPADKNKYTRIVLKLEKDFNLIKKLRQSDNGRFLPHIQTAAKSE